MKCRQMVPLGSIVFLAWCRNAMLLALSLLLAATVPVQAQAWPAKPVRWISPFPAGSVSDTIARLMAQKLSDKWGQQVIVENKPGGFTVTAAVEVARAPADGYTLFQGIDFTWTMNQFMFAKPQYDPLRDFTHISQLAGVPLVISANEKTSVKSLAELIALAKAQPGTVAIGGAGPIIQVGVEKFSRDSQIKMLYVPYKGGADSFKGMLTGEIPFSYDGILMYLPHYKSGKMRPLATTGVERAAALPDVPTLTELGFRNSDFRLWHSISGPVGLPRDVQRKIQVDVQAILAMPDIKERLIAMGMEAIGSTAEQFVEAIERESAKGSVVIKELGLRLD